jgi:hypothetical protein
VRNTPLAVPLAMERNPSKRGARFFSAGIPRVDAWSFYHVIEMWSSVFASQQYSMPMSQLDQSGRTTIFAMSGLAPIAAVMLQCRESVQKCSPTACLGAYSQLAKKFAG